MWIVFSAVMMTPAAPVYDPEPYPGANGSTPPTTVDPIMDGATEPDSAATPDPVSRRGLYPNRMRAPAPASEPPPAPTIAAAQALAGSTPTHPLVREPLRFDRDERTSFDVGIGIGALLRSRRFGDPETSTGARSGDRGGVGELRLRFIGFLEAPARSQRFLWFIAPDLRVHFVFGGTASIEGGPPRGLVGGLGQAGISGGLASKGRVGAYAKGSLMTSFLAAGTRDDAYVVAPLGLGGGLRIAPRSDATLLLGPRVDAVLGVQDIAGPRRISQIAAGADLAVHAIIGYRAYLAFTGSFDASVLGQSFGGRRLNGQGTLDLAFPFKHRKLRLTMFMSYRSQHVTAPPGSQRLPASGMALASHVILAGFGVGS